MEKKLKACVESIEMPRQMQERIIENCLKTEENTMKNRISFKKMLPVAAVIVLCLCAAVGAAGRDGSFRDITDFFGAVTGTEYVDATHEMTVTAKADGDTLTVTAALLTPDAFPYREMETLALGAYRIVDAAGKVVAQGEGGEFAAPENGAAQFSVPVGDLAAGEYRLLVESFTAAKKADQPLAIRGEWECNFSV